MSWLNQQTGEVFEKLPDDGRPSTITLQGLLYDILKELREIKLYQKAMSDEDFTDDAGDELSVDSLL